MDFMPPKKKTILSPDGGWKQQTFYIVEAAFSPTNPIHRYIFYTGFLNGGDGNEGIPGGYNGFPTTEDREFYNSAHYLLPVHELCDDYLHEGVSTLDGEYNLVKDYQPNRKEYDG